MQSKITFVSSVVSASSADLSFDRNVISYRHRATQSRYNRVELIDTSDPPGGGTLVPVFLSEGWDTDETDLDGSFAKQNSHPFHPLYQRHQRSYPPILFLFLFNIVLLNPDAIGWNP